LTDICGVFQKLRKFVVVAYTGEFRFISVAYTGKSGLTGVGYTGE
jgi:hypothetical protein